MASFTVRDQAPAEVYRDAVRRTDAYVAIVGFWYGSPVQDHPEVSYTEFGIRRSNDVGLPRLALLLGDVTKGFAGVAY
jgi:hypothetical protein